MPARVARASAARGGAGSDRRAGIARGRSGSLSRAGQPSDPGSGSGPRERHAQRKGWAAGRLPRWVGSGIRTGVLASAGARTEDWRVDRLELRTGEDRRACLGGLQPGGGRVMRGAGSVVRRVRALGREAGRVCAERSLPELVRWSRGSSFRRRLMRRMTEEWARRRAAVAEDGSGLSGPAFDARSVNPAGWTRAHDGTVLALGPPGLLPLGPGSTDGWSSPRQRGWGVAGTLWTSGVSRHDRGPRGNAGSPGGCGDPGSCCGPRCAARGVAREGALQDADGRVDGVDDTARELASIRARRIALGEHSFCGGSRRGAPWCASVSALLVTCRPALLGHALGSVWAQDHPNLELVLVLNGKHFDRGRSKSNSNAVPACP